MRVLVCDDDASLRLFLSATFEAEGWDVEAVESGEECLAALEAPRKPDVLVLDQVMPGLQGTQVADQLRRNGFTRPIVLCSANLAAARAKEIRRLDLLTVNKIDVRAVVRLARSAALAHHEANRESVPRRRQAWPD
jgi:CheY-like chemotaxis protein